MTSMKVYIAIALALIALIVLGATSQAAKERGERAKGRNGEMAKVERGRYIVSIAGCNDCHTNGFMAVEGKIPEAEWLMGSTVGFKGPWGVTYPINLRLLASRLTESEFVQQVRTVKAAPPMPWWVLHEMTKEDVGSIYAFLKHLGPKGEEAPSVVPPGTEPTTPYVLFEPQFPKEMSNAQN